MKGIRLVTQAQGLSRMQARDQRGLYRNADTTSMLPKEMTVTWPSRPYTCDASPRRPQRDSRSSSLPASLSTRRQHTTPDEASCDESEGSAMCATEVQSGDAGQSHLSESHRTLNVMPRRARADAVLRQYPVDAVSCHPGCRLYSCHI